MDQSMRALRAHERGGAEQLRIDTVPVPTPQSDEVLIAVHATAITFAELGWDETWEHVPTIPAHEFSGVVVERGDGVDGVELHSAVYGLIRFDRQGAAADYVSIPAADVAPKPVSLSHAEAAAMPLAALTAWQGLFDLAGLQSREHVLVHGGAGGVGSFAVQLAKIAGARVTTTVRSADAVAFCLDIGADEVIDTQNDGNDGSDQLDPLGRGSASARPFDVVFDTIGGEMLDRSYDVLAPGGRLITLQAPPDQERARQAGVSAQFFIVAPDVRELAELARLADHGLLRVALSATYPLEQGRQAFESGSRAGRAPGKTVLLVRDQ